MNKKNRSPLHDPVPPGATRAALERDRDERHGGPPHTPPDDRHATGEPPDEHALTGLVGPEDGDKFDTEGQDPLENGPPYSGRSGGAVGGTPAERRAAGGHTRHGIAPEDGEPHVDSTIGRKPSAKRRKKG